MLFDNEAVKASVARLYDTATNVYIACTGAGSGADDLIWQVPGASGTLMESSFPYAYPAFDRFVGRKWGETDHSYCGKEAAIALAQEAYFRCMQMGVEKGDVKSSPIGVGLAAAVSTNRELKGGTRCHAAVRTEEGIRTVEVWLEQGFLGRDGDGKVCDLIALNMVLEAAGVKQVPLRVDLHLTSDNFVGAAWGYILNPVPIAEPDLPEGLSPGVFISADGQVESLVEKDFSGMVVFPGSFWPLQYAHDNIASAVATFAEKPVVFEITTNNADKSVPSKEEILRRATQFAGRWPVILRTGASLFVEKVHEYPGVAGFAVGADTAIRIFDPKYYGGPSGLESVLEQFAEFGTKFYVFKRVLPDGEVLTCESLPIPEAFKGLFVSIPGRWDISSTAIRDARNGADSLGK